MAEKSRLTFEELADLADPARARLSDEQRADLLTRAQADPAAAAELARLQGLISLMRSDAADSAPDWVVNRAVRLFRQGRAQTVEAQTPSTLQQLSQLARRIVAVLQFDSAQTPLTYGVRSGGDVTESRHLLYGADDWVVDVRIEAAGSQWRVTGQLLGIDDAEKGVRVVLGNESTMVEIPFSALSEFSLPPVPAGIYELALHLVDGEIVIPDLAVGVGGDDKP